VLDVCLFAQPDYRSTSSPVLSLVSKRLSSTFVVYCTQATCNKATTVDVHTRTLDHVSFEYEYVYTCTFAVCACMHAAELTTNSMSTCNDHEIDGDGGGDGDSVPAQNEMTKSP
jgi:hypothetical protein